MDKTKSVLTELLEYLKPLAERETLYEGEGDANAYEASGGNYDDVYALGLDDGETELARHVLNELSKEPKDA